MQIKRSELVEGKEYFMDTRKDIKGVFRGRDEEQDSIYFQCEDNDRYSTSVVREGLTMFSCGDDYKGFEEVEQLTE
jgi:hypothetical protein